MKKGENLLTPEDVAEILHVSRKTVVVMAREARIPCIRVGHLIRFDANEITRWIDRNRC
jgi:excisionase family DNA binding protein